ncbi:MAG: cupin domain-containing protein [Planctomycetota bacterium JB042]
MTRAGLPTLALTLALGGLPACGTLFDHFSVVPPEEPARPPLVIDAAARLRSPPVGDPAIVPLITDAPRSSTALVVVKDRVRPHVHARSDETVYVLEGEGDLLLDREWRRVTAGTLVHVPIGVPHAFVNRHPDRTVVLSTFTPPLVPGDRTFLEEEPPGR